MRKARTPHEHLERTPRQLLDRTRLAPLVLLGAALLVSWALWAVVLYPKMLVIYPEQEALTGVLARAIFWCGPCAIYLARYWGKRALEPLGLTFPLGKLQAARALLITLVVAACLVVGTAAQAHVEIGELVWRVSGVSNSNLTAPLFEELVFRGVVLSELLNWTHDSSEGRSELRAKFWLSQLAAATLFVAIHWPFWFTHLGFEQAARLSLPVFATGLILGFVFATTRSIWGCILLHWLNNVLSQVT